MLTLELLRIIRSQYQLPWDGIHGYIHWARVLENGLILARKTGAVTEVVELFAVFHDACRINDGHDPEHGLRGALLAQRLRGSVVDLSDQNFDLLCAACELHTEGRTLADVTVQTCWDADRLDLGRVGIMPRADALCTAAAKDPEMIRCAYERSFEVPASKSGLSWEFV